MDTYKYNFYGNYFSGYNKIYYSQYLFDDYDYGVIDKKKHKWCLTFW